MQKPGHRAKQSCIGPPTHYHSLPIHLESNHVNEPTTTSTQVLTQTQSNPHALDSHIQVQSLTHISFTQEQVS
jgi:hypothetical protein